MGTWISVHDRLPESDTEVLVLIANRFVRVSYYFSDSLGSWFSDVDEPWDKRFGRSPERRKGNEGYPLVVTHWMELPEIGI